MNSPEPDDRGVRIGVLLVSIASLFALLRLVGCGTKDAAETEKAPPTKQVESKVTGDEAEFLRRVVAKYQAARAYSDQGKLKLSFQRDGHASDDAWNWSVTFVRPGRIQIDAFNSHIVSDASSTEKRFLGRVIDAESNNIDNQVVSRPAPETLKLEDLSHDPLLFSQVSSRFQRPPIQLELLLGEKPLETLLASDVKLSSLSAEKIESHSCRRIQGEAAEGTFVFWIDEAELLLRRIEFPGKSLLPELAGDPLVNEVKLTAELTGATFSPKVNELAFSFEIPPGAKLVKSLIVPPILIGSEILGKTSQAFEFIGTDGAKFNQGSLLGKTTVLFWYANHAAFEGPFRKFLESQQSFAANKKILFKAICTEPSDVGDKAIADQLKAWKVDVRPLRDLNEVHGRVFGIRELPSVTVFDAEGRLQAILSGPAAVDAIPEAVNQLILGTDLAGDAFAKYAKLKREYDSLVSSGGLDPVAAKSPVQPTIAKQSEPQRLKLKQVWSAPLKSPQGIAFDPKNAGRLFATIDDGNFVSIDAADGNVTKIELPSEVRFSAMRSYQTKDGTTYYAGFTPLSPGVHLFDQDWKFLFTYPDPALIESPIIDVQLADLDSDGELELLVAFADTLGLHGVSLEGMRLWVTREYVPILSVAVGKDAADGRRFAMLTGQGGIFSVNETGSLEEGKVRGWSIAHLFSSSFQAATESVYCALALDSTQKPCLLALDAQFREVWNYPLPVAMFSKPIDFLTSGKLRKDSSGEWVAAWADGSIHIVSENGSFDDHFNTGFEIAGIVVLEVDGEPLLVVSGPDQVIAWKVE